ncbi:peptidoglycan-binding protein [Nonomuraea sp. NPDC050663]|uniref:peptidoglycan-binding protein n=1 Tax=Nonomuraea sp. NPDC050663 TaxID=3364370 RepID=UPI0037BCD643
MSGVEAMIDTLTGEIGYREKGNNLTKFNQWLGPIPGYPHEGRGYPWCHSALSWGLEMSGNAGAGPKTASCLVGVRWFKDRRRWYKTPRRGDFVYYGADGGTHVELVTAVTKTTITTVGGNTSGVLAGAFHNGDGVYEKTVARNSSRIYGYGRPDYPPAPKPAKAKPAAPKPATNPTEALVKKLPLLEQGAEGWHVKTLTGLLWARGFAVLPGVDETTFTKAHAESLKAFQDGAGLAQTGKTDDKTWAALLRVL